MSDACNEAEIRSLMLHAQGMVLWQAVETWDEQGIRCRTLTQTDAAHPLRRKEKLSAIHLGEYGAQLMAIHGALLARRHSGGRLQPGVLTSLRDFEMTRARIDDISAPLHGSARVLVSGATGSIYEFEISATMQRLAGGRVSVISLPAEASPV